LKIAVIVPFSGGDIILSQKLLAGLKHDHHQVDFYTDDQFKNIVELNPHIDKLITCKRDMLPTHQDKTRYESLLAIANNLYDQCPKASYDKVYNCHSLQYPGDEFWHKIRDKKYTLFDFVMDKVDIPVAIEDVNKIYVNEDDQRQAMTFLNGIPKRKNICIDLIAKSYPYDLNKLPSLIHPIALHSDCFNFILNKCQIEQLPHDSIFKNAFNLDNVFIIDNYTWREWSETIARADYYIGIDSGISFLAGLHRKKSIIVRSNILPLTYSGWHYLFGHDNALELNIEDVALDTQFNNRIGEWIKE
jgi:hypothetical protein